jgi:hypothetical protein
MAKQSDFTEEEWEALKRGVTGAGLLVSVSDPGFFDTFKEVGAMSRNVMQAQEKSSSEFVRELADIHGTGFGVTSSRDKVEQETLQALETAMTTLASKAPEEVEAYRQFVLDVAQSVAQAAPGGEGAEAEAIEKVRSALS